MNERTETTSKGTAEKSTPSPTSGAAEKAPPKRKPRQTEASSSRGKVRKNANDLKLEAIKVLTNLPEGGRFFITYEMSDGTKETINSWN